jgi:hypothetical protein
MKNNSSERHIVNNLKVILNFDSYFQSSKTLDDMGKDEVSAFLDSKIKSSEADPERKWITTWNHYLNHLKFFFRWLSDEHGKADSDKKSVSDWETPEFLKIKMKKSKRLSPYSQNDIWDSKELLAIINYEPSKRNRISNIFPFTYYNIF